MCPEINNISAIVTQKNHNFNINIVSHGNLQINATSNIMVPKGNHCLIKQEPIGYGSLNKSINQLSVFFNICNDQHTYPMIYLNTKIMQLYIYLEA